MSVSSPVEVVEMTEVTDELIAAFERLIPQLSSSSAPPSRERLSEITGSPRAVLFVAREPGGGAIVGSLTLVLFVIPTGLRARIEDVVVDEAMRGRGVGEALSTAALDRARTEGARNIDLSSRPSREAANRLYQRLGFVERETVVYRYPLD